jgi:hypothetical protein
MDYIPLIVAMVALLAALAFAAEVSDEWFAVGAHSVREGPIWIWLRIVVPWRLSAVSVRSLSMRMLCFGLKTPKSGTTWFAQYSIRQPQLSKLRGRPMIDLKVAGLRAHGKRWSWSTIAKRRPIMLAPRKLDNASWHVLVSRSVAGTASQFDLFSFPETINRAVKYGVIFSSGGQYLLCTSGAQAWDASMKSYSIVKDGSGFVVQVGKQRVMKCNTRRKAARTVSDAKDLMRVSDASACQAQAPESRTEKEAEWFQPVVIPSDLQRFEGAHDGLDWNHSLTL